MIKFNDEDTRRLKINSGSIYFNKTAAAAARERGDVDFKNVMNNTCVNEKIVFYKNYLKVFQYTYIEKPIITLKFRIFLQKILK